MVLLVEVKVVMAGLQYKILLVELVEVEVQVVMVQIR